MRPRRRAAAISLSGSTFGATAASSTWSKFVNVTSSKFSAARAHCADQDTGRARLTYDELTSRTTLSRVKVSRGLKVLEERTLITRRTDGRRSDVGLANYDRDLGWAKLPVKSMYAGGRIRAFEEFSLRRLVELDAMKLFFLFAERRDRGSNLANISYDGIERYTGIARQRISRRQAFWQRFPWSTSSRR